MGRGWPTAAIRIMTACTLASLIALSTAAQDVAVMDDSDWWSTLHIWEHLDLSAPTTNTQQGELAGKNFEILSVVLGERQVFQAEANLGKSKEVNRGDAALGRAQLCYSSIGTNPRVHLIFEAGGEGSAFSFYLFEDGANWNGSQSCAKSRLISADVRTASGLRLGQSPADVQKILGKPSQAIAEKLTYVYEAKKKTSIMKLDEIRKANPTISEKEILSSYGFYFTDSYIEARFVDSKLTYLGVTKSETFP